VLLRVLRAFFASSAVKKTEKGYTHFLSPYAVPLIFLICLSVLRAFFASSAVKKTEKYINLTRKQGGDRTGRASPTDDTVPLSFRKSVTSESALLMNCGRSYSYFVKAFNDFPVNIQSGKPFYIIRAFLFCAVNKFKRGSFAVQILCLLFAPGAGRGTIYGNRTGTDLSFYSEHILSLFAKFHFGVFSEPVSQCRFF